MKIYTVVLVLFIGLQLSAVSAAHDFEEIELKESIRASIGFTHWSAEGSCVLIFHPSTDEVACVSVDGTKNALRSFEDSHVIGFDDGSWIVLSGNRRIARYRPITGEIEEIRLDAAPGSRYQIADIYDMAISKGVLVGLGALRDRESPLSGMGAGSVYRMGFFSVPLSSSDRKEVDVIDLVSDDVALFYTYGNPNFVTLGSSVYYLDFQDEWALVRYDVKTKERIAVRWDDEDFGANIDRNIPIAPLRSTPGGEIAGKVADSDLPAGLYSHHGNLYLLDKDCQGTPGSCWKLHEIIIESGLAKLKRTEDIPSKVDRLLAIPSPEGWFFLEGFIGRRSADDQRSVKTMLWAKDE